MDDFFFRYPIKKGIDHFLNAHALAIFDSWIFSCFISELIIDKLYILLSFCECVDEHFNQSIYTVTINFCCYVQGFDDFSTNFSDLLFELIAFTYWQNLRFLFFHP
jgi:hypothetical protein